MFELFRDEENPFLHFQRWFEDAIKSNVLEPDAMTLATATKDGMPSARVVLFKENTGQEIVFYTNYTSRKSEELIANPNAALVFYWPQVRRQIRIEGTVKKTSRQKSQEYFSSRPRGSQLAAMSSRQSKQIFGREELLEAYKSNLEKYESVEKIECPETWGGFELSATSFEFWVDGEFRLHDRLKYTKTDAGWMRSWLSP